MTQMAHRRNRAESVAKSLYASPLVIHGNEQRRAAQGANLGHEIGDLMRRLVVSAE
jgi:hypothetical protein